MRGTKDCGLLVSKVLSSQEPGSASKKNYKLIFPKLGDYVWS